MSRLIASSTAHRHQHGSAVLIVFMLLAIMGLLIVANNRMLYELKAELNWLDQQQQQRLVPAAAPTNSVPAATVGKPAIR